MPLGMKVGLGPWRPCVRCEPTSSSSPKRQQSPQFSVHVCCGQTAGCIKMALGMEVSLGQGRGRAPNFRPIPIVAKRLDASRCHWDGGRPRSRPYCARWGPSFPPPKGGGAQPPIFGPTAVCGQTAVCITILLGTEVGLSLGDIVLDVEGTQLPCPKGAHPHQIFGPCILWPNGWMDEDATWYGRRRRPGPHCVRRGPSSPPPAKGVQQPGSHPLFGPCLLWPRSPISSTVELLLLVYFCFSATNFVVNKDVCYQQVAYASGAVPYCLLGDRL